ncbi:hypothetical protein BHV42_06290 [Candidatus Melainabacteria bacterium MEL.A1]|nr:hypothetical protein BHV42_06290 [Candidatus Melainabacteria bacterium MEL.A1]
MLRKAGNRDISRIAEILIFTKRTTYRPIFKNANVSFNEMQVLKEIEKLSQPSALDNIYVYDDGIVKAMVKIEDVGEKTKVSEFFVDPFFQGEGIGTKILNTVIEKSQEVFLYVLDKNEKAIRFYVKMGFKYTGEKEEFLNSGFYMLKYFFVKS